METWQGEDFFEYFNFYTGADPTNGWVNYLDQHSAESSGLVKVTEKGTVYIGVDHQKTLSPSDKGRDSVRVGTHKYYGQSLVIADIAHMPGNACGSWPAFWTVGQRWPEDGEIDIIEGVNLQDHNEIVMHTAGTCSLGSNEGMTGFVNETGCGEALGPVGCVIEGHKGSYGDQFNQQGGGVYALEWTDDYLKIFYFPRHSIPDSITRGEPDPSEFGLPMALVQEGCDVANSFKPQSFVFDVTFCGDWAGGVFGESGCPMTSSDSFASCTNYVAQNPAKFKETYWEINSVKVYQLGEGEAPAPSKSHETVIHETTTVKATQKHVPHVSETHAIETDETHETHPVDTHATQSTHSVSMPTHPVEQATHPTEAATHSVEQIMSINSIVPEAPSAHLSEIRPATEAPVEQQTSTVTEHLKAATTRYVTEFVTDTTTICTSSKEALAHHSSSHAVIPSSHVVMASHEPIPSSHVIVASVAPSSHVFMASSSFSHALPTSSAVHGSEAGEIEPPTSWNTPSGDEGVDAQTSSRPQPSPAKPSAPPAIPHSAPSQIPTGADAVARPSASHPSAPTSGPTAAQAAPTSPATNADPFKPSAAPTSPQTSKPIIPRPSANPSASGSDFRSFPGASSSAMGAVFTGAADKLSIGVPFIAAAFGLLIAA